MIRQRSSKPGGARLPLSNTTSNKLAALRRANYALKRSKNRLLARFKLLSTQLNEARERAQKISEEELDSKLCNLDLPGAQLTAIKECIAAARLANKNGQQKQSSIHRRLASHVPFVAHKEFIGILVLAR